MLCVRLRRGRRERRLPERRCMNELRRRDKIEGAAELIGEAGTSGDSDVGKIPHLSASWSNV